MTVLFNSNLKHRLVTYTILHFDETFYLRELARAINEDAGNLSKELKRLEKEGLYSSVKNGKEKFYSVNLSYPLFNELKKFVFKAAGLEGFLKDIVLNYPEIELAFLAGGGHRPDLIEEAHFVVIGNVNKERFDTEIKILETGLKRKIDLMIMIKEEFRKDLATEDSKMNNILRSKVTMIKGKRSSLK